MKTKSKRSRIDDLIQVTDAPRGWSVPLIAKSLAQALRQGGFVPPCESLILSVSCVGAARMSELNALYRGKPTPTDVLSFEQQGQGPAGVRFLGDLVLCVPVVRRQAAEHGHGLKAEVGVLLAHGLLHLLGYDHERSAREDARMARAEQKLLEQAGLGRVGLIRRTNSGVNGQLTAPPRRGKRRP